MANSITADEIREQFSQALSAMYQQEVPQYGTLLELVADVNLAVLENNPQLHEKMVNADELARLNVERHGAIRVGTAQELATLRRMFAIMGMYPVSYYDLSQAGVPVHSTAFRPIDDASLARNPFRVFTSLLRLELIENEILRQKAAEILRQRDIFTPRCRQLLEEYEQQGGFNETQAQEFVQEALETFRWHQSATVDEETYRALHNEHRLIADVVCFPGCHINHLTPRTLDIDRVQSMLATSAKRRAKVRTKHPLAGKLVCGDCGSFYGHKVWRLRSTGEHYNVWYCNHKYDGDKTCESPRLRDEEIKAAFEKMLQKCGDPAPVYTDEKWNELVESVKVCRGGHLIFNLTDGKIVKVTL